MIMRNLVSHFFDRGWCRFDYDASLKDWVDAALTSARATLNDARQAQWLRYQGTWFAGVNALPNDRRGVIAQSGPLTGKAVDFIRRELGLSSIEWDQAQVSICYPGYPLPMEGESEAKARYRREYDAAHLDGLLPEGPERRRHLREHHAFILGIPMVDFDAGASPFVVWEGSHEVVRDAFIRRFDGVEPHDWGDQDVTEVYQAVRQQIFVHCPRVEVSAKPGEAYLAHRLLLHGMAPWQRDASAGPDGRMICYFRPNILSAQAWLQAR